MKGGEQGSVFRIIPNMRPRNRRRDNATLLEAIRAGDRREENRHEFTSEKIVGKSEVNHPKHYNSGQFEVIDVIEDWGLGFNDGNAIKYIGRHKYKNNPIGDLQKAKWYIAREIQRLERLQNK